MTTITDLQARLASSSEMRVTEEEAEVILDAIRTLGDALATEKYEHAKTKIVLDAVRRNLADAEAELREQEVPR